MSDSDAAARPRQLTMAGWFVIGGSAFLVLTVFDALTNLNSVDSRDRLVETLSMPPWEGLGLSVDQALGWMRVLLNVAAVCGAAAAVLGAFVLQRHNGARIALTVVAVPVLVTAPLTGGLIGALIAAATAMLWTGPARDWFAGRPVRESASLFSRPDDRARPERPEPPAPSPTRPGPDEPPPAPTLSTGQESTRPGASHGYGAAPVVVDEPAPSAAAPSARPLQVHVACLITFGFSVVVALVILAMMVMLARDGEQFADPATTGPALERAGLSRDSAVPLLWAGLLMVLAWALTAAVLAWFTWRRHDWARYLLVTSAVAALVATAAAFPVGLVVQAACVAVCVLLFSAPARAWFAGPSHWQPPVGPQSGSRSGPQSGPESGPQDPGQGGGKPPVW